jgi:DNA-binding NarL/FixJ family response regulator
VSRGGPAPHVAVEGGAELFEAIAAEPTLGKHRQVSVVDDASAADALWIALRGGSVLVHAMAERTTLDRLYEDLRRLGPVTVRTSPTPAARGALLDADEVALLGLLAAGRTLREAAVALHISPRTADRRVAGARAKLGVATTIEAVAALAG